MQRTHICFLICILYDEWYFFLLLSDIYVDMRDIWVIDPGSSIIIYTMIKNILISAVIGVIGEVALIIIYVVKSSIFEGGIQKVLDVFNLSGHFDNFTSNIFDIKGIVYFLSVIAVCLFLTTQSILKRRWN